jgi:hypothetical protein
VQICGFALLYKMLKYLTASRKGKGSSSSASSSGASSSSGIVPVGARGKRAVAPRPFVQPDLSFLDNIPARVRPAEEAADELMANAAEVGNKAKVGNAAEVGNAVVSCCKCGSGCNQQR